MCARFLPLLIAIVLVLAGAPIGPARLPVAEAQATYAPGQVLVGYQPGTVPEAAGKLLGTAQVRVPELGIYAITVAAGQELMAAASLRGQPGVAFAEPDYIASVFGSPVYPNDPDWDLQWGLARIGAPRAWSFITDTSSIIIAIVDSGLDPAHPDLAARVWTNPGEIPGNGLDDDGDDKVDDVHGWHFYHNWAGNEVVPQEDREVQDDYGHGTHVAGIAAAATNNGVGVAGLAWGAQLLPVKVLDGNGLGLYSEMASGILYATDRGARVINVSAGGASVSAVLCSAVAYARDRGSLVVAAAGNAAGSVFYPAACPGALAVAASDRTDLRASFSNIGPELAVTAPGVDIYSTWYRAGIGVSSYETLSGTSMAAPFVSGLAALIGGRWPGWGPVAVTYQITATAADVEGPGWDPQTGWGRIDAARSGRTAAASPVIIAAAAAGPEPYSFLP